MNDLRDTMDLLGCSPELQLAEEWLAKNWWEYALEAIIKLYYWIFHLFIINVYISCYNYIVVLNMRFGGKPNYTCEIINNKEISSLASKTSSCITWWSCFPYYRHK
jgi:hypothetical protein